MDDSKAGYQATPSATLEQQMMDACAPKNEREWWAFVEIGRLRAEVASLTAQLQSGESFHAVAVRQRDAAWGEVEKLKATLTQQCKGFRADVEKLEAEVEALRADAALKRDLLLWALYHAQGGSSRVGQAIRRHLGIEQHARLTPEQIKDAERAAQGGE